MSGNSESQLKSSKAPAGSSNVENLNGYSAKSVIKGKVEERKENTFTAIGPSDKGNVVGTVIEQGGELHLTVRGGMEVIGGSSEEREKLARIQAESREKLARMEAENKVLVAVMFSDDSEKYRGRFDPSDTLYDVRSGIKKNGKQVSHFKYSGSDDEIDITTPVASLKGNLVAVLQEENLDLC